jgi:rRNA processing protein Krr1/Pno1
VRVPRERVGVLVGPEGRVKQFIEERLMVELRVESESGGVTIVLRVMRWILRCCLGRRMW